MRVVFMGTPQFAQTVLEILLSSSHQIVGVVTRPDAVRARGKRLESSPVKQLAQAHDIKILEATSFKHDEVFSQLASWEPDVICVAAYGALLPKRVLELPSYGCLNVHGSLLPRWRGAAPVERAILAGDSDTGIGIMRMEEGLDTGPVCKECRVAIEDKPASLLSEELAQAGGKALVETLDTLERGLDLVWAEQSDEGITYAEKLEKGELNISPDLSVEQCALRVQASSDHCPVRCMVADKTLTVLSAQKVETDIACAPGHVILQSKKLYLGCVDGVLELIEVKPDGKKVMQAQAFALGVQGIKQGHHTWSGVDD